MTQPPKLLVQEILVSKPFQDFVGAARDFCHLIEQQESDGFISFLRLLQRHLSSLYPLGLDLPAIDPIEDVDFDMDLTDDEKKKMRQFINDRIPFSFYWAVLNPIDIQNLAEIGTGDLLDDLEETYRNIKSALIMLDSDRVASKENAVWKFKFDYDSHWNAHCIGALHIIHGYLSEN